VSVAILVSALCSIFEAVLYSVSNSHIEVLAKDNKQLGRALKKLKKNIEKPITAILTLNTIANTMGAAVAGASAAAVFGDEHLGWFSVGFTVVILLFSEILPKTAGVAYAKGLAPWIAAPLTWLVKILTPIIWLIQMVTRLIPHSQKEALVSAEEIQAVALLSRKSGEIDPDQEKVIANILKLQDVTAREVMTPRTVTFALHDEITVAEAIKLSADWSQHSRAPVYDKDIDDVVGIVLRKDVFLRNSEGKGDLTLSQLMHKVHFVPENARLNKVLIDFFERRQHLFVVVDEYGSFTGVISMEDIIEEIVGREIIDETDKASDLRELARLKRRILVGE
jgi:CBS domain containing-hemolysin-like protein